ncbi:MAG: malto-oligosyltrehalose synthase [Marmoricola sp.]
MNLHATPSSTYRLQLSADLTFADAERLLPYLADLGVGWLYLSPVLQSTPGSSHGYDVVDPARIDADRGGQDAFDALCRSAHQHGLGVLVDLVPNHVGVGVPALNPWWWDLLTHGRDSRYAAAFDVDWAAGDGRLVLPVLGEDDVRDDGSVPVLRVEDGELRYHEHRFPLAPGSAPPGDPGSWDANEVHARQHYRLAPWREEAAGLNYRRFFAVSSLAAVRVEDHDVFEAAHVQVRRWFDSGLVDGLRVDHPDGLRHPRGYLVDLADVTSGAYTLIEKILEDGEELPRDWPIAGTTGYEVLALVDRVLVDRPGVSRLEELDARLRGRESGWPGLLARCKRDVATTILSSEVRRLGREIARDRSDLDPDRVRTCLVELLTAMPVYRSYLPAGAEHLDAAGRAVAEARPDLTDVLDPVLALLHDPVGPVALRFQQTSGMVMAKGAEDRAFYRWSALTSLDEVGGDPSVAAASVGDLHAAMRERQLTCPHGLTSASTHDTKRGEDVRARIHVLSERPEWWATTLAELSARAPVPDPGLANLLWQAVLGCWPAEQHRIQGYAEKAMREAGDRTTWTDPDVDFEKSVHAAVTAVYEDPELRALVEDAAAELAAPGWSNALSAKLIGLTVPGVPDVYQGSELWEQSLVDPDNRRPVDFERRRLLLAAATAASGSQPPARPTGLCDDGAAKLHLVSTVLRLRRDHPELFSDYRPVQARGAAVDHVVAFDRGGAITVATRLPVALEAGGGWRDTTLDLPPGTYRDVLTGRRATADVGDLLAELPVALLVREDR